MQKKTNEQFLQELKEKNGKVEVLEEYKGSHDYIMVRCKKCGYEWKSIPTNLYKGVGCPKCANNITLTTQQFANELSKINPDLEVIGEYVNTKAPILVRCKNCGNTFFITPLSAKYSQSANCKYCSDGVSYPNKFGYAFVEQLPVQNICHEWIPEWAKPYSYDNYFEYDDNRYILEMDGGFHYEGHTIGHETYKDVRQKDNLKDKLAAQNNVEVIRIDCRESKMEYIRNNIMDSRLAEIFNLSKIDWDYCEKQAQRNIVKDVCKYYMEKSTLIIDITAAFHKDRHTISKYLKIGTKIGWCDYPQRRRASIDTYDANGVLLCSRKSVSETTAYLEQIGISVRSRSKIYSVLNGIQNSYKGLVFKYSDYTKVCTTA